MRGPRDEATGQPAPSAWACGPSRRRGTDPALPSGSCARSRVCGRAISAASPSGRRSTGRSPPTSRPSWHERAGEDGTGGWPGFVRREFEAYLRCGILDHGLLRVRCERCGDITVVGFSCQRARVLSELRRPAHERARRPPDGSRPAVCAHPPVGVHRAGAGALPARVRCGADARGAAAVLAHGVRLAATRAARRGLVGVRSGSVTAIQRFGGSANLNVHFHSLVFDGVYTSTTRRRGPIPPPPAPDRYGHRGVLLRAPPPGATTPDPPWTVAGRGRRERSVPGRRAALASAWRRAPGPRGAGPPRRASGAPAPLGGRPDNDRAALGSPRGVEPARGCGSAGAPTGPAGGSAATSCARPWPLERLTESTGGQLLYQFRRPWCDGSTALLWSPGTAGALGRPRAAAAPTSVAYHGLLAPRSRWRAAIVPTPRLTTHASTSTRAPRDGGPGRGCSSACSGLRCWCATAAGAGGGSSAR